MEELRQDLRSGLDCVNAVTELLQRSRAAHRTAALMEAADYSWWWRVERPTDDFGQLFWFDQHDVPVAAVVATQWGSDVGERSIGLDPILMPDASAELIAHVLQRGLQHVEDAGLGPLEVMVDAADNVLIDALGTHGFVAQAGVGLAPDIESWLEADQRPKISPLADGYRLVSRANLADRPHHFAHHGPDVAARLDQTPLYRADLDLVVLDRADAVAAHGLFWFDEVTQTGLVEPMRTMGEHQRQGLARHLLTAGIERLSHAGAERIKIVVEASNEAAKDLYLDVGFQPAKETIILTQKG